MARSKESGNVPGKVIGALVVLGLIGGGVWAARSYMAGKNEKKIQDKYFEAKKSDFIVTVKLAGNLASTDVEVLKCELEGSTTIRSIVEEGTRVKGPTDYNLKTGDTLEGIAKAHDKHELSIRQLNQKLDLDWDNLPSGQSIRIPGDLLVELDPINLKERINSQEIDVERARSALVRAQGGLETMRLSTALELKRSENAHQNAVLDLKKVENSTVQTHIQDEEGKIENLRQRVDLSELNVKAYSELKKLGFVSDVELLKEKADAADTQHRIKIALAELEAYKKYDQIKFLSEAQLKVDEAVVTIQKTKVENVADLNDANSTVSTAQKTLELEIEKLKDLEEQMANTRIYAPDKGSVVYWSESSRYGRSSSEPITDGASVRRGQNLIKLPKTDSLMVELSIPQSSRADVRRGMKAWIQVEDVILRGTVTMLAATVDTNRRSFSNRTGFKAEVTIDPDQLLPDSVSEGMAAKVEILVKELTGKHQLIKVPNQCITSRTLSKEISETGCWVLNDDGEHDWRPVIIVYHDEDYIAIEDEEVIQRCIRIIAEQGEASATKLEESLDLSPPRVERILEELVKREVLGPKKNDDKLREIKMELTEANIRQIPQRLRFQAAEPFKDENGDKIWGDGEKFTDINENGVYDKGEQVFLSPLSEADKLNLAESVENKSRVEGVLKETKDPVVLLSLDEEQKPKWKSAEEKMKKARKALEEKFQSGEVPQEEKLKLRQKLAEDFRDEVKKFLTAEQLKLFNESLAKAKAKADTASRPKDSGSRPGGGGRSSGSSFEPPEELKLTAEQKQKWEEEAEFSKAAFEDARERQAFTEFQKIREEFGAEIKKFLTAEQMAAYEKSRAQRSQGGGGRGGGSMLSRLDTDGDGKISESEYKELSERAQQFMGDFGGMDTNGDGFIDSTEQEESSRRMRERFQNRGGAGGDNVTEESRDKGPRESDREAGPRRKGKKNFFQ